MKTAAKRLIERTAHNALAWFTYGVCGRLSHYLGQIYGHARWAREQSDRDDTLTRIAGDLFPTLTVSTGPFEGLRYPCLQSVGSALLPKLLGSYESELRAALEALLATDYDTVVDIGCAEGYYAVGLGLRLKNTEIYAFDTDPRARQACAEMARLNGVESRVHIGGLCDKNVLRLLPLGRRALIVADCEGYEKELFDHEMALLLAKHTLIIEAHDFIDIEISSHLRTVFSMTHCVESVRSTDDIQKAHTYQYEQLGKYDTNERRLILGERRPAIMEWLVMTPLSAEESRKMVMGYAWPIY
jgi:precorrin-6B methylase 2